MGTRIAHGHLDGVGAGRRVSVYRMDPATEAPLGLIATATVGAGGRADLPEPLVVRAGEGFVAVPEQTGTAMDGADAGGVARPVQSDREVEQRAREPVHRRARHAIPAKTGILSLPPSPTSMHFTRHRRSGL